MHSFYIFFINVALLVKNSSSGKYYFWTSDNVCPDPVINPGGPGSGRNYMSVYETNRTLFLNLHANQFYNLNNAVCVPKAAGKYPGKIKEVWVEDIMVSGTENLLPGGFSCPFNMMFQGHYSASPANDTFKCYTSAVTRPGKLDSNTTQKNHRISAISLQSRYRQLQFFHDQIHAIETSGEFPVTQYLILRFTVHSDDAGCMEILQQYQHSSELKGDGLCLRKKNFILENFCKAYACPKKFPTRGPPVFIEPIGLLFDPRGNGTVKSEFNFLEHLGLIMPGIFLCASLGWLYRKYIRPNQLTDESDIVAAVVPELRSWIRRESTSPVGQMTMDVGNGSEVNDDISPPPYEDSTELPTYEEAIKIENDLKYQSVSARENEWE